MKFDLILNHNDTRRFEKILCNGQDCIVGTPKDLDTDEKISVLNQDKVYPTNNKAKVLYPVAIGDYIFIYKRHKGTISANYYRVVAVTDTFVIGGSID